MEDRAQIQEHIKTQGELVRRLKSEKASKEQVSRYTYTGRLSVRRAACVSAQNFSECVQTEWSLTGVPTHSVHESKTRVWFVDECRLLTLLHSGCHSTKCCVLPRALCEAQHANIIAACDPPRAAHHLLPVRTYKVN